MAINLPIAFLQDPEAREPVPANAGSPGVRGIIIEINGTEVIRNLEFAKEIARQLRFHKIAISIDDLGAEWPSLIGLRGFPFVELKIDRKFVAGCADDRLKRAVCHRILELADGCGVRTVAEGVETVRTLLQCVRWVSIWPKAFCSRNACQHANSRERCWATPSRMPH